MMLRSFVDLLTFGFACVVAVFFVMAFGLCVALVLDYVRHREKGCGARMTIPYVVEPNGTQWRVVHEGTRTHRLQVIRPAVLDEANRASGTRRPGMIVSTKARKRRKLTPSQRQHIYANNGGYCVRCGLPIDGAYDIDHVIPLSRGGTDDWYNLGPSHPSCNRRHGQSLRNQSMPRANVFTPRSPFFGRLRSTPPPLRKNSAR